MCLMCLMCLYMYFICVTAYEFGVLNASIYVFDIFSRLCIEYLLYLICLCLFLQSPIVYVPQCYVITHYYIAFCYMMLRRFTDAVRILTNMLMAAPGVLNSVSRISFS